MENIFEHIQELQQKGQSFVLCSLTESQGSVPRKAGSKMVVLPDGGIIGTIGGGVMEKEAIADALQVLQNNAPLHKKYIRHDHNEKQPSGWITVFFDPLPARERLFIFGAGHVGASLARLAKHAGFSCIVIDPRPDLIQKLENEGFLTKSKAYTEEAQSLDIRESDFVFITTHSHETDRDLLAVFAGRSLAWLGMIGSQKKAQAAREYLLEKGLATPEQVKKIEMPAGIPIMVHTPAEIAVSILARLIDIKNSPQLR
ncbi:MAG: XdhC family protein [Bacteroidales bacterium]